ncbi:uncharacterized protein LOC129790565 isoform X2 [Lutzomyia longipalpis]|uniref:uncharacterized protein LOC129790565 isoform X2 n=1 Tax=Lutzomyia longipalpis TaxID=7200 RepID=UPI0024840839|nr:uncharacterized protein LOC129790565 isoform X2 [Lutzomyia longipalpis]
MKDGELIEKYSNFIGRHHVKDENSYVLTESDIEDGENVIQATLGVSQAQPWHEGKYQCNTLHPNYHYLRVVVNSGGGGGGMGGKWEDLHRHRQREKHGKARTTSTTTMAAEIDVVASQLTSSRPATTTQELDTEDGTTSETSNDDVDSQIDAGTSTTGNGMDAEDADEREEEKVVVEADDGEDGAEEEADLEEIVERVNNGDDGVDDDLVVDIEDDGGNGRKIEMENVHVNELGEDIWGVSTAVSETTHRNLIPIAILDVVEEVIEKLSMTSSTARAITHGSESDVRGYSGKVMTMTTTRVDSNRVENTSGKKAQWGSTRGMEPTVVGIIAEKDKQLEKIVKSKGERLIIIKRTSYTQGGLIFRQGKKINFFSKNCGSKKKRILPIKR